MQGHTCVTKAHKISIDLLLTNRKFSFQLTHGKETGIKDVHFLILPSWRLKNFVLKPKTIILNSHETVVVQMKTNNYHFFKKICNFFLYVTYFLLLIKRQIIQRNNAPLIIKKLKGEIYKTRALKVSKTFCKLKWKLYRSQ